MVEEKGFTGRRRGAAGALPELRQAGRKLVSLTPVGSGDCSSGWSSSGLRGWPVKLWVLPHLGLCCRKAGRAGCAAGRVGCMSSAAAGGQCLAVSISAGCRGVNGTLKGVKGYSGVWESSESIGVIQKA